VNCDPRGQSVASFSDGSIKKWKKFSLEEPLAKLSKASR
jgi:hypothetical protein